MNFVGENLGYVDGKDHGTVEALAAFDVENSNEARRYAWSERIYRPNQDLFGGIWANQSVFRKFELEFLLKRLALFTRRRVQF